MARVPGCLGGLEPLRQMVRHTPCDLSYCRARLCFFQETAHSGRISGTGKLGRIRLDTHLTVGSATDIQERSVAGNPVLDGDANRCQHTASPPKAETSRAFIAGNLELPSRVQQSILQPLKVFADRPPVVFERYDRINGQLSRRMSDTGTTASDPTHFEVPASHLLCGQADMSPRARSAYTYQRWMFAKQAGNVTIVASPSFINQAFLQSDTLIEVDDSHVMEVDDCRLPPD